MSTYDWLLFLHVTAAFAMVSALLIFAVVTAAVWARERPSEVALLFRLTRPAAILVAVGSLGVLALGLWLAEHQNYGIGDEWVIASIVLWLVSGVAGDRAGRHYRRTQLLAERLAGEGDRPSPELRELVRGRTALALQVVSTTAAATVLVLMVFKPGAY